LSNSIKRPVAEGIASMVDKLIISAKPDLAAAYRRFRRRAGAHEHACRKQTEHVHFIGVPLEKGLARTYTKMGPRFGMQAEICRWCDLYPQSPDPTCKKRNGTRGRLALATMYSTRKGYAREEGRAPDDGGRRLSRSVGVLSRKSRNQVGDEATAEQRKAR